MTPVRMPAVAVRPDTVAINGGMNTVVSPMMAKPGTARLAYNYEWALDGGLRRVDGIEPFDGRPAPQDSTYVLYEVTNPQAGLVAGAAVSGNSSLATGTCIYVSAATGASTKLFAMTAVTGTFLISEILLVAAANVGTISNLDPQDAMIDGYLDNDLSALAATVYRASIAKPTGSGAIRGVAVLNDKVYVWRDNAGGTAMAIWVSAVGGWTAVPLYYEISFTVGSGTQPAEGVTLAQGAASATLKRVVLESGTYAGGTAAGRYITTIPTGGVFGAGAFTTAAHGTIPGAGSGVYHGTQITLSPAGRVQTDAYTFTASLADRRLYGCDGVNREFEFDGLVYVPLVVTGMGSIRATTVRCHRNYLFFGFRSSIQKSAVGAAYQWSAVLGAGEIGAGDDITNLISVGGAVASSSLMVLCKNAIFVLYEDSTGDFLLTPLSRVSGGQAYSAQDIGGVVALDTPGVVRYPASQSFGNFAWDMVSIPIQSTARNQTCNCSVYVPGLFKYRIFLSDGSALSGLPIGKGQFHWSILNYGRTMVVAEQGEISGVARTFYGDSTGWVYEADVGRSFAGDVIEHAAILHPMSQKSQMVNKSYRYAQLEISADSAIEIQTAANFNDSGGDSQAIALNQLGAALQFDVSDFDTSYFDGGISVRQTVPCEGIGPSVAHTIFGSSAGERSHTIHAVTVVFSPRRIAR